jgi:hypothetical protein
MFELATSLGDGRVWVTANGRTDAPTLYHDGRIGYDWPEARSKRLQGYVARALNLHDRNGFYRTYPCYRHAAPNPLCVWCTARLAAPS